MTPERTNRLKEVAHSRQFDLTVVLENVHDPHNLAAVMRTCDAIGVPEIYVINTDPQIREKGFKPGKKSSAGTRKWVDVHYFEEITPAIEYIRERYEFLWGTMLVEASYSIYDLDLCSSVAIVFGNEKEGISEELAVRLDKTIYIPQSGMVQSLNISVACAVTMYEAYRQRLSSTNKHIDNPEWQKKRELLFQEYIRRHEEEHSGRAVIRH